MSFAEISLFLRHLTFRKVFNFAIRSVSTVWARVSKRATAWGMPWSYSIEPANYCNLHCRECFTGMGLSQRKRHTITEDDFKTAVDNIKKHALNLFLYFQGEPFINKDFHQLVEYAHCCDIFTVTSSNGQLINVLNAEQIITAGLDKIIIPLDGYNQESYSAYRSGGDFAAAKNAITLIATAKKRLKKRNPVIEVQCLASKITENHLKEIKRIAMDCGADMFCVKTMQIETEEGFINLLPKNQRLSRYTNDNKLKHPIRFCRRIFQSVVITSELNVLPCCYDKNTDFRFGNLRERSLAEVLKSDDYHDFISRIEQHKRPPMCQNCQG